MGRARDRQKDEATEMVKVNTLAPCDHSDAFSETHPPQSPLSLHTQDTVMLRECHTKWTKPHHPSQRVVGEEGTDGYLSC